MAVLRQREEVGDGLEIENHSLAQTPNVTGDILQGSIEYSSKKRSRSRLMCRLKFLFRLHRKRDA